MSMLNRLQHNGEKDAPLLDIDDRAQTEQAILNGIGLTTDEVASVTLELLESLDTVTKQQFVRNVMRNLVLQALTVHGSEVTDLMNNAMKLEYSPLVGFGSGIRVLHVGAKTSEAVIAESVPSYRQTSLDDATLFGVEGEMHV